jgi:hypothetical protein
MRQVGNLQLVHQVFILWQGFARQQLQQCIRLTAGNFFHDGFRRPLLLGHTFTFATK